MSLSCSLFRRIALTANGILFIFPVINIFPIANGSTSAEEFPSSSELGSYSFQASGPVNSDGFKRNATTGSHHCSTIDNYAEPMTRNGVTAPNRLWKHFRYFMSGAYLQEEHYMVNASVEILGRIIPCVTFEQIVSRLPVHEAHVVVERSDNDCNSEIGNWGRLQTIKLSPACLRELDTALHEFIHALGIEHEQNRPDRDDYVNIHWENIHNGAQRNFEKVSSYHYSTYDVAYNKKSVMHYDTDAWTINGKPTISFKEAPSFAADEPFSFGPYQYTGLQRTDILKLQRMYSCGGPL